MDRNVQAFEQFVPSIKVALHRSAWIEILVKVYLVMYDLGRTPQECVDRNFITLPFIYVKIASHSTGVRG